MSKCCNPLDIPNHGVIRSDLRHPTEMQLNILKSNGKILINKMMFICTTCRKTINTLPSGSSQAEPSPMEFYSPTSNMAVDNNTPSPTTDSPSTSITPSSDETTKQKYNIEKIKALAIHLGLPIPRSTRLANAHNNFRRSEAKEVYRNIITQINKLFPPGFDNEAELRANISKAFLDAETTKEKVKIVKLLPQSWSFEEIKLHCDGVTDHIIKSAKEGGSISMSIIPIGRPSKSEEVKEKVVDFYLDDETTRLFPGRKDCISIKMPNGKRENIQKRLLLGPIQTLYNKYNQKHPDYTLGLTTFRNLRPKQCVYSNDPSAANVCVCMIHANMDFLVQALKSTDAFDNESKKELMENSIKNSLCTNATDACKLRECDQCSTENMVSYVAAQLDQKNVENVSYSLWVTNPQCDITSNTTDVDLFLDLLKKIVEKFITHQFKVEKQYQFIKAAKTSLVPNKKVIIQMDFAENYSCFVQNAIQSHYFSTPTVTIHPFVVFYKTSEESPVQTYNVVIINEIRSHNTTAVYAFQEHLMNILRIKFPQLEDILYLSDGCAEQYKNRFNFKNLCMHKQDFNINAEAHFFPTSHGKGECDGIGGNIKRMAKNASNTGILINDAKQFYDWAMTEQQNGRFHADWEFVYVPQKDYDDAENKLRNRFEGLRTLPGTKKFHEFIPLNENQISVSEYSGCETKIQFFLHKQEKRKAEEPTRKSARLRISKN